MGPGRGPRRDRDGGRRRGADLLRAVRLPGPRAGIAELEPRIFSFNSPHGACPRCTGLGSQMEIDPDLVVPDPTLSIAEGAIAPWSASASNYYEQLTQSIAERYDVDLERAHGRAARLLPPRDERRADPGQLPQPLPAPPLVHDELRGHRAEPRAPLPGDGVGLVAGEDRGVHDAAAVPGVRRRPAAPRVAGGAGRRHAGPRVHPPLGAPGPRLGRGPRPLGPRPPRGPAHPARDRGAAALPRRRGGGLPLDGPGRGHAVGRGGAATRSRRSGSSLVGVLYILDEPSIGLHQRDNAKLSARCSGCATSGTPSSWSSTTRAHAGRRPSRRHGARSRRARGVRGRRGHRRAGRAGPRLDDRPVPRGDTPDRGAGRAASRAARSGAQPARRGRRRPARRVRLRDRRLGVGQVDPDQRRAAQGGREPAPPGQAAAGRPPADHGPRPARQDHRGRPVADRAHAARTPRRTSGSSIRSATSSRGPPRRARAATSRGASRST